MFCRLVDIRNTDNRPKCCHFRLAVKVQTTSSWADDVVESASDRPEAVVLTSVIVPLMRSINVTVTFRLKPAALAFFRNPIPDYYTVTLEISRDRTTMAREIICDDSDPTKPRCPDGYVNGDTYLHRTLNEACPKMVSIPETVRRKTDKHVFADDI